MRHRVKRIQYNRDQDHKESLLRNLATQLFLHGRIVTTRKFADGAGSMVEKIMTRVKGSDKVTAIRYLKGVIYDENASKMVLETYLPKYEKLSSGFLRKTKVGVRPGDNAQKVQIEFV